MMRLGSDKEIGEAKNWEFLKNLTELYFEL